MREQNVSGLSGWGRFPRLDARGVVPEFQDDLRQVTVGASASGQTLLPRGCGKSYGDAAIDGNSSIVWMEELNRLLTVDVQAGTLRCEAGLTLAKILEKIVPEGWFLPVLPGTVDITVGGAIASDIHGKNHHRDGSFSNFVRSIKLLPADSKAITISKTATSDLFRATAGGMGLTGIIAEAELQLRPIETEFIRMIQIPCFDLQDTMQKMEKYDREYQYCVCWIDCLSGGKNMGRSILTLGKHANRNETNKHPRRQITPMPVPFEMPSWLVNKTTVRMFNDLYFSVQSKKSDSLVPWKTFFCPLDALKNWNRLYGKAGFIQYQLVVPQATSAEALEEILTVCTESGFPSSLCVLKRLGAGHGMLSFPIEGYTLAMDFPLRPGVLELAGRLDKIVIGYGGRVYLAKDACLTPSSFRAMYPEFPQWQAVKKDIDPKARFASNLARRLKLNELE